MVVKTSRTRLSCERKYYELGSDTKGRKKKKQNNKAETSTENPTTMSTETIIRKKQVGKSIP